MGTSYASGTTSVTVNFAFTGDAPVNSFTVNVYAGGTLSQTFNVGSSVRSFVVSGLGPNSNWGGSIYPNTSTLSSNCVVNRTVGNFSFSIPAAPSTQTISGFNPATPISFIPSGTFALSATGGGSGNPVVFASTTGSVCSVSGNTATLLAAGTCTLTANQAGNANYYAAAQIVANVTINTAGQAISFGALPGKTFGDAAFAIGASASSGLPVSFSSLTPGVCAVSNTTVNIAAAGTCTIAANQAGNGNYTAAAQVTQSLTVAQAVQTITGFNPATPISFSPSGTFALAASGGASGNAVAFASTTPAVCTVSANTATLVAAGTCTITANQAGNANYAAAAQVAANVAVSTASQSISFAALSGKTFGNAPFAISASTSSGLAVSFSSTTTGICTVSGSTVSLVAAGICTIAANQAGNGNYSAAQQVTQSFAVSPTAQVIAFTPASPVSYSAGGIFALTATGGASGNAVTFASTTPAICTVTGSAASMVAAGTCTLTANQAGNANYSAAPQVVANVVIGIGSQAITGFNPVTPIGYTQGGTFALSGSATQRQPLYLPAIAC